MSWKLGEAGRSLVYSKLRLMDRVIIVSHASSAITTSQFVTLSTTQHQKYRYIEGLVLPKFQDITIGDAKKPKLSVWITCRIEIPK